MVTVAASYAYQTLNLLPEAEENCKDTITINDILKVVAKGKDAFRILAALPPFILIGGNNLHTVALMYAAAEYNCTCILLPNRDLLSHIMKNTGVKVVVSTDENYKLNVENFKKMGESDWLKDGKYEKGHLGILTSGTTSLPKVCLREWSFVTGKNGTEYMQKSPLTNRLVLLSSITHIYALKVIFIAKKAVELGFKVQLCLCSSGSQVFNILSGKKDSKNPKFTLLCGTPSFYSYMCTKTPQPMDVQIALSGGTTLPPEVFQQSFEKFNVRISQAYGSTEVGTVSSTIYDANDLDNFTITKVEKGVEMEIMKPSNGAVLREGEQGAVHVHTPFMSIGYIIKGKLIPHPYFYAMGDGGSIDNVKYASTGQIGFKLGERLRDPIKRQINGFDVLIQGFQVEKKLLEHPLIVNALVLLGGKSGKKDKVVARLVIKKSEVLSKEDIWFWCGMNLVNFVMPDEIEIVEYLKCSGVGKLTLH